MRRATTVVWACALGSLLFGSAALASTELPGQYDGRALAIGGTGPSYIENGASVYLNPATLDGIQFFAGTAVLSPFILNVKTPVLGPNTSKAIDTTVVPLFLAGAGLRLSDRIVVGFAFYPTSGLGATYSGLPGGEKLSLAVAQFEASPAVSFKVIDGLSLGLGYRITYSHETTHQPGIPMGPPAADVTLSGVNYFGVHAGVYYRPTDDLHFGLTYRSKVTTSLSGTTESGGAKLDTTSEFASPARVRFGASYTMLDKRLMLAIDAKYIFYSSSNKSLDTTIATPAGPLTESVPFDWKDVLAFGVGAEYWTSPLLALRAGYSVTQSATPDHTANPLVPPPGFIHGIHAGVGVKLANLDLDLGGAYIIGSKHVDADPANGVVPGVYSMTGTMVIAASATYHM